MRYVRFASLLVLIICAFSVCVCAEPDSTADTVPVEDVPVEVAPTIPVVALDPDTVQAIAEALLPTEADTADTTDPTIPVVELAPDSVAALSQGVADALVPSDPDVAVYSSSPVGGGYYFVADCALGKNVKIYVPVDFAVDSFAVDKDGLVNMTNSTVYAFSQSFPDYNISCSRFGRFTYRRSVGGSYQTYDLNISRIVDTNMSFFSSDPPVAVPVWQYWLVMIVVVIIVGALFCFFRRH